MAPGCADYGGEYAVDLNIPDVAAFQGGRSHEAHATFDGDILSSPHPSQPWLASLFTDSVPSGLRLSRIIILFDSACTTDTVTESWPLDDFVTISPEKIHRGNSQHVMLATGRGTLVTTNMLPDCSTHVTSFEGCLFVPGFGTNLLSVKKLSANVTKTAVFFRAGAQFLDAAYNLMEYFPELIYKSDLYPLFYTIISGDVTRQYAMNDITNVIDFLQKHAHFAVGTSKRHAGARGRNHVPNRGIR